MIYDVGNPGPELGQVKSHNTDYFFIFFVYLAAT